MAPPVRWAVPRPFRQLATDQVDQGGQAAKEKDERRDFDYHLCDLLPKRGVPTGEIQLRNKEERIESAS
jgi:hypothetical protein